MAPENETPDTQAEAPAVQAPAEPTPTPADAPAQEPAEAPKPAKRARRKATAPAKAATPSSTDADQAGAEPLPGMDTAAPAEAPAKPKRTRKKATAKKTAAVDAAPAEAAAAGAPESAAATADPAAQAPAPAEGAPAKPKRTRKKAAAKKTAAPVAVDATADAAAPEAAGAEAAAEKPADAADTQAEKPAPAKRTRRKKAAAPAQAPAETPAPEAVEPAAQPVGSLDAAPEVEDGDQGGDVPVVAVVSADAIGDVADESEEVEVLEELAPENPAPQGFGILFQAPDPTVVRRSRRAGSSGPVTPPPAPAVLPEPTDADTESDDEAQDDEERPEPRRRRSRRSRGGQGSRAEESGEDAQDTSDDEGESADSDDEQDGDEPRSGRRRRRGGKGRRSRDAGSDQGESDSDTDTDESDDTAASEGDDEADGESGSRRRRRRRSRSGGGDDEASSRRRARDEVVGVKGSTRLEAKRQRRREGREAGRRRTTISEAEFLARREAVERTMVVKESHDHTQIGVLEDGVLVEHYISSQESTTAVGNIYLGRVQNVLPSMEAAFVDIGKGRNAVLYAGEVNWDAAGIANGQPRRIEDALKSGGSVLVQVTKDPIGHKGARLTSQISLPGRYLVYVPNSSMTGISRKLPDTERQRLKRILKEVVPADGGVIVRTAAEGASEEELRADVERLVSMWDKIQARSKTAHAPSLLHGEADMTVRVIRDVFNEDFSKLVVSGRNAYDEVRNYVESVAPDLAPRVEQWVSTEDLFAVHRVDEALAKAMDRKVWLPSGGSLVIDRTEAMTVIDVNTGKFVGSGGNLEETVTKNNLEAAEEIVRQLRLRDIGGIVVVDFIDMVLESNRDLVVRRLVECLGRDRTKHQVAEVTSLGLVQMTRKRVGAGLIEVFSEPCQHCNGRGIIVSTNPVGTKPAPADAGGEPSGGSSGGGGGKKRRGRGGSGNAAPENSVTPVRTIEPPKAGPTAAQIAAAAHAAALSATVGTQDADDAPLADAPTAADVPAAEPTGDPQAQVAAGEQVIGDAEVVPTGDAPATDAPATTDATGHAIEPDAAVAEPEALPLTADAPAEPEPTPIPEAPEAEPAAPKRRRRGRVVAPAGPPRAGHDEA